MGDLYLRNVILTIVPQLGTVKQIKDLRVGFSFKKTNKSTVNSGEIYVYNLNSNTRGLIATKNSRVVLYAGYESNSEVIFSGNITKVSNKRHDVDLITTIEVRDGDNSYRTSKFVKSYAPNVSTSYIIEDLITESKLARGNVSGIPETKYINGYSFTGLFRDCMDEICQKNDLEWSIQNEAIQISAREGFNLDSIISLSAESGLIESPSKTKNGIEFKSLLQPRLIPGKRVAIQSKEINDIFTIKTVTQEGDSEEGNF